MTDEVIASVHQGTKPIDLERDAQAFSVLAGFGLADHKLIYSLLFLGLVGASVLYFNLGVLANGSNSSLPPKTPNSFNGGSNQAASGDASNDSSSNNSVNGDSLRVDLNTSQTSTNGQNSGSTTLKVNGQDVPVTSGNVHKTFTSEDGHTKVEIHSTNNSSSTGGSD